VALLKISQNAAAIVIGKQQQILLALACFLAKGHLLIEDVPGMGKTTLAHVLARVLGLEYNRIQFTSDMLPSDILGGSLLQASGQGQSQLQFIKGPVFTNIVLADEINRAPPRSQSALLEAMEEHQVSMEGQTFQLPKPFFVIATQNPREQLGTFALPESQLDRFHMRIRMGYPDEEAERQLLAGGKRRRSIDDIEPCLSAESVLALQAEVEEVHVSDALLDYLQQVLKFTRNAQRFEVGLSPRAGLALRSCAQAWAYIHGRDHVLPEDVQQVLPHVVEHRLEPVGDVADGGSIQAQLSCIAIP
jgi:MoxR-like ATPase